MKIARWLALVLVLWMAFLISPSTGTLSSSPDNSLRLPQPRVTIALIAPVSGPLLSVKHTYLRAANVFEGVDSGGPAILPVGLRLSGVFKQIDAAFSSMPTPHCCSSPVTLRPRAPPDFQLS